MSDELLKSFGPHRKLYEWFEVTEWPKPIWEEGKESNITIHSAQTSNRGELVESEHLD